MITISCLNYLKTTKILLFYDGVHQLSVYRCIVCLIQIAFYGDRPPSQTMSGNLYFPFINCSEIWWYNLAYYMITKWLHHLMLQLITFHPFDCIIFILWAIIHSLFLYTGERYIYFMKVVFILLFWWQSLSDWTNLNSLFCGLTTDGSLMHIFD